MVGTTDIAKTSRASLPDGYVQLLDAIKREVASARVRTALAVNEEMIALYWRIGRLILDRQQDEGWGTKVIGQLAADLRAAHPQLKGFSRRSLQYMRTFAQAYPEIAQQAAAQLPWGHIMVLLDRIEGSLTRDFYARKVIEEGWSRAVLEFQIKTRLHERIGTARTNFERTVPIEDREDVRQLTRDPYLLDFVGEGEALKERALEDRLAAHIVRFLQALGAGFAFVGRQHCLLVDGDEFFIDLLFYNLRLRRYVVIELKVDKFRPEYAGKLAFYVNVVDGELRDPVHDQPTIGILLVANRNNTVVEYALRSIDSPLAVSTFEGLPPDVRAALPSENALASTLESALGDSPERQFN